MQTGAEQELGRFLLPTLQWAASGLRSKKSSTLDATVRSWQPDCQIRELDAINQRRNPVATHWEDLRSDGRRLVSSSDKD